MSTQPLVYPKADFVTQNFEGSAFHRGALCAPGTTPKIVPHTTEGGSWPGYDGGASAPHLTFKIDLANKRTEIRQHWDLNRYARALATRDGALVNNGGAIQYEIVGTSGWASGLNPAAPYTVPLYVPEFPDWFWDEIAEFHAWCHTEIGVDLQAQDFYPWNATGPRMDYQTWLTYSGVVGHQGVPYNDHLDPGAIPMGYVLEKARAIVYGRNEPVAKTKADALALERELRARGFTIYCGPSHHASGVCRRGNHGHDNDSYHWLGLAIDAGLDPAGGPAVSNYERAHLDRLAIELRGRGWRILWNVGPGNHQDHLHADTSNYPTIINLTGVTGITLKPGTFPSSPVSGNKGFDTAYVKAVQRDINTLVTLGILKIKVLTVDGSLGPATQAAVKAYQALRGLVVDGQPGNATRASLDRDLANLKANDGFTQAYVKDVQTDLNTLITAGWLDLTLLTVDGSLGPAATAAVKAYQKYRGLKVDGLPGGDTVTALKADVALCKANDGFAPEYVKAVQRDLNALIQAGVIKVPLLAIDGSLGPAARGAVRAFQALRGIVADGLPGPGTRAHLDAVLAELRAPKPPAKTLAQRVAPYRLGGKDAFHTNVLADQYVLPKGRGVVLAARETPDVDSAQNIQARGEDVRVLLTAKGKDRALPTVTLNRIKALKPAWVIALGSSDVVSDTALYQALTAAGINVPS